MICSNLSRKLNITCLRFSSIYYLGLRSTSNSRISHYSSSILKWNDSPSDVTDVPGVKAPGDKMILMYTCKVCDTRSAKKISKQAYYHGTVVVRCGGCKNLHLIADRKGIFEDGNWDIQQYLQMHGESVKVVTDDTGVLELTSKDLLGSLVDETSANMQHNSEDTTISIDEKNSNDTKKS